MDIVPFDFEDHAVRVLTDESGRCWFVAKDVCAALGLSNPWRSVERLDADERDDLTISDAVGRSVTMNAINESGLYSLILTSRKDSAKRFKKWVTAEVLPSIRKTGRYELLPEAPEPTQPVPSPMASAERVISAGRCFGAYMRAARHMGLSKSASIHAANNATHMNTGVDLVNDLQANDLIGTGEAPLLLEGDSWEQAIKDYLVDKDRFTLEELFTEALNLPIEEANLSAKSRIGRIVGNLGGWRKHRPSRNGRRVFEYVRSVRRVAY